MKSYIVIDRSGSMASRWDETIGAVNAYAEALGKEKSTKKAELTVVLFDNQEPFKVIREDVKVSDWKPISATEASPRGMTPLYDAIGTLVNKIKEANPKKASVVIVTDGHENASREFNKDTSKKLLDEMREKKYDVVFIGADFDAFGQSGSVGVSFNNTLNITKGNYDQAFKTMAVRSALYGEKGPEIVANFFSEEIRASLVK